MPNYCGSLSAASPKPFLMGGSRCCPQAALRLHVGLAWFGSSAAAILLFNTGYSYLKDSQIPISVIFCI